MVPAHDGAVLGRPFLAVVVGMVVGFVTACSGSPAPTAPTTGGQPSGTASVVTPTPASSTARSPTISGSVGPLPVLKVTDGDTFDVRLDGRTETIRVIGIDSPEITEPAECFGPEASTFAAGLLAGGVSLRIDPSQNDRDQYGRLLRQVILPDGSNMGERMIAGGYAYEYTYDRPYAGRDSFLAAQQQAQTTTAGLWSPTTCNGTRVPAGAATTSSSAASPPESPAPPPAAGPGANCAIKGNINSKGEKIYHVAGRSPSYDDTVIDPAKGERYFCSEAEALAAGWRPPANAQGGSADTARGGGDLGLPIPMSYPACDGLGIVVLKSAITSGAYAQEVQAALDAYPGSSYLRTDAACPSLSQATPAGDPIYAVYIPAGYTTPTVCAALAGSPEGAYGRWLDTTSGPDHVIEC